MNYQVAVLLESTIGSAPDMTHNLRLLGDGDMGAGIRKLWLNGSYTGAAAATMVLCGSSALLWLATRKHRKLKKLESLDTVYKEAFRHGKEYAWEFQDKLEDLREKRRQLRETKQNDKGCWWYCDECDAFLNEQDGFTTETDQWTCTECGHVNDVSAENILPEYTPEGNWL